MAQELLDRMTRTGFGPVTLENGGGGIYRCEVLGRVVEIAPDGDCIRLRTTAVVPPVPAGLAAARGYDPVRMGLHELAIFHRPDVVTIDLPGGATTAVVTIWIDVATAAPAAVAGAALTAARLADLTVRVASDAADLAEIEAPDLREPATTEAAPAPVPPPPPPPPA